MANELIKLGQFQGGATYVMAVKDDLLFTATGPLVEIWRLSRTGIVPADRLSWVGTGEIVPEKIGELGFIDYSVGGLEINGNHLYVGNEKGLAVVDISDPTNPIVINTYYNEQFGHIKIKGTRLYATTDFYFYKSITKRKFKILDISDPLNISELGSYTLPGTKGTLERFDVAGNYAYLPLTYNLKPGFVYIIDISNLSSITGVATITGQIDAVAGFSAVQVDETRNILFALEYSYGIHAYDISNPALPAELGYFGLRGPVVTTSPLGQVSDMKLIGNVIYFSAFYQGITTLNVSDPANMTVIAFGRASDKFGYVHDIVLGGNYAYVANMGGGFSLFNIADPAVLTWIIQIKTYGIFYDVRVKGNYAYVAADHEFMVIDFSDLSYPLRIASLEWARSKLFGFYKDNYVIVDDAWRPMAIIDISDPKIPEIIATYADHTKVGAIVGDIMYLGKVKSYYDANSVYHAESWLDILDLSALPTITLLGSHLVSPEWSYAPAMAMKGNYIYAWVGAAGLRVLDVTNPAAVIDVNSLMNGTYAYRVAINGNYLYVEGGINLYTFDISDPANPVLVNTLKHGALNLGGVYGMGRFTVWNNFLVGSAAQGLVFWDITNPALPAAPVVYPLPTAARGEIGGFDFLGSLVFPAIAYKGIQIYQYGAIDVAPPVISNLVANPTDYYATITWDTDEITSSVLKYGTSPGAYTKQAYDGYKIHHTINLINLEQDTTYYFVIESKDPSGNSVQTGELTFKTVFVGAGWREGFDDESKISSKNNVIIKNGEVKLPPLQTLLAPKQDAVISPIPGRSTGGSDLFVGDSDQYRSVIEFDIPPTISEVLSVKLKLIRKFAGNPAWNQTINLHLLTNPFNENRVDWINRTFTDLWTTPGGDYNPTVIDHYDATGSLVGEELLFDLIGTDADTPLSSFSSSLNLLLKPLSKNPRYDRFTAFLDIVPARIDGFVVSEAVPIVPDTQHALRSVTSTPPNTSITFDLIDAITGVEIVTGLSGDNIDVTSYVSGHTSVMIRSVLSTTDINITPVLYEVKLEVLVGIPMGGLTVTTSPTGASVYLDNVFRGNSPITISGIPAGTHSLKLTLAGYQDHNQSVIIQSGLTTALDIALTSDTGSLSVSTTPTGASIFLDNVLVGFSSTIVHGVRTGTHSLKLSLTGYQDYTQTVIIEAGKTTTINIVLDLVVIPAGTLAITTTPVSGDIYVNGQLEGNGSVSLSLAPGQYAIAFGDVSGYISPLPQSVDVVTGMTTNVTGTYIKEEPVPIPEPSKTGMIFGVAAAVVAAIALLRSRR